MRLNKSTDYAIQMLLYLAKAGKTVSSSKLAAAMGVSHRYLLQISAKLRRPGSSGPPMVRLEDWHWKKHGRNQPI